MHRGHVVDKVAIEMCEGREDAQHDAIECPIRTVTSVRPMRARRESGQAIDGFSALLRSKRRSARNQGPWGERSESMRSEAARATEVVRIRHSKDAQRDVQYALK